ncbi:MAG: DMT family transporter [Flavobacteriaceae bacterium]|nr:DMT family transporter [Flavobacteriaceae bacterium]
MPDTKRFQNLFELNISLLLISTSGPLGRYIDLPVPVTIAFRALVGGMLIYLFCRYKGFDFRLKKQDRKIILAGGVLMLLHWITYFYALKLSNVSIGMLSLFTFPVFTALLEPLLLKTKFQTIHLVLAGIVLVGIYFLVPDFDIGNNYTKALGFGVFSAVCYALRNIIMKYKVSEYNGSVLMLYQLIIIGTCLFPSFFILDTSKIVEELPAAMVLALLTTALGHTLFLYSFKHFSTTSVSIMSSVQPIYGILLAMLFLNEHPDQGAVLGGGLILVSVIVESMRAKYFN